MRNNIQIIIFLCIISNVSCQSYLTKSMSENEYTLKNNVEVKFTTIEFTNTSKDDILVWIGHDELQIEKDYFFEQKGDFTLASMIYENLLSAKNMIIGESFLKILNPSEKLRFHVILKDNMNNKDQINRFEKLVKSNYFSNIILEYRFQEKSFPSYKGFDILISI